MTTARPIQWAQLFRLPTQPPMPLQARLRAAIVQALADGQLDPGARLPSSRDLATQLGLSRNTVNSAYQQLIDEGFLEARQRSGVYVSAGAWSGAAALAAGMAVELERDGGEPGASTSPPDWSQRVVRSLSGQRTLSKPQRWWEHAYPFVYGHYDAELFPTDSFRECCARSLARAHLPRWTPDFETDDVPDLIEQIRTRLLPQRGVFARRDEILITLGAQHAYYLLGEALFTAATVVGMEEPGHPHARTSFSMRSPRWVRMPVDDDGVVVEPFPDVDYAFVTPSHQSPTTVTLSLQRRHALLAGAAARDAVIIEDDYEAENLYAGSPLPALKSLDDDGRVIYVGSIAKSLSPALRLGFIVASPALIGELRPLRHAMLRHPSAFLQHAYALFLKLGHHESHARRVNRAIRERIDAAADALTRYLPECRFRLPQGGASIWVSAPPWLDSVRLAAVAREHGVLIEAGDVFFAEPAQPCPFFRLRLSSLPAARIGPGIEALARAVDELRATSDPSTVPARPPPAASAGRTGRR